MPFLFIYLLKLSVSLTVVFIFYHFVLRKLTFYNWNRYYLLSYSLLSFFIAFIDITPVLESNEWSQNSMVQWVPVLQSAPVGTEVVVSSSSFNTWQWISLVIAAGMGIMLIRLLVQLISFHRMIRKARAVAMGVIPGSNMKLYQVDEDIIPFSFGNSIFINHHLHTKEELREIVWHEFIHVKQKHSLDIIAGEILCLLNWYNPFAWLLRRSIRENLEFIADDKVLGNGVDRKEYQYLLLKVIGNKHFSIAPKFNFSSLKKRIAMMNKMKSAGVHIVKFLFILPLIAVLLVAFRNKWESPAEKDPVEKKVSVAGLVVDAATHEPVAGATIISRQLNILVQTDAKGYYKFDLPFENRDLEFSLVIEKKGYTPMQQQEHWGNFYVDAIYQTYGKTIEFFALGKEGAGNGFSTIAGNPTNAEGLSYENVLKWFPFVKAQVRAASYIGIDTVPYIMNPNSKGYFIEVIGVNGECTVVVKDKKGKEIERVMLNQWKEQKKFEEQYGEILAPPPQPPTPPANAMAPVAVAGTELPVAPVPPAVIAPFPPNLLECPVADMAPPPVTAAAMNYNNLGRVSSEWEITDKKAEIKLKDGTVEKYNLTDLKEKAAFEKKYGKIYHINTNVNANVATTVNTNVNSNVNANVNTVITIPPYKVATGSNLTTSVAPVAIAGNGFSAVSSTTPLPAGSAITMIDPYGYVITGNEDIVIRITKSTTREELEKFKTQMKAKGVELDFDEIEYNDKGILVSINGTMKSGDSRSNFVATDFESVVLAMVKKGQKTYFKVSTKDREVI